MVRFLVLGGSSYKRDEEALEPTATRTTREVRYPLEHKLFSIIPP